MRFHSTPRSVLNGEITKLAIIECVVAVAAYVGFGVYFHTFRHLAVAVAVAPLMLFRSEASVRWGLENYSDAGVALVHFADNIIGSRDTFFFKVIVTYSVGFCMICAAAVIGVVIRVVSTLYWVLRRPLHTLSEMPRNWLRQSFCTDLFYPPEVLPLEAVYGNANDLILFSDILNDVEGKFLNLVVISVMMLPLAVFCWVPSLFYRISFKATSLVYFPFIWIARRTLQSASSIKLRLERITKGELEKTGRALSLLLISVLAAKIGLAFGLGSVSNIIAQIFDQKGVESLVVANICPWWILLLLGIAAY